MWMTVLLVLLGGLSYLYFSVTKQYGYFKSRGVAESPGSFPFGSPAMAKMYTGRKNFIDAFEELYKDFPGDKMVGYYSIGTPQLMINDLDLAKTVFVKDFEYFVDRRYVDLDLTNPVNAIMDKSLLNLKGDRWKTIRSYMSPAYTSGKLKTMMPLFHKTAGGLVDYIGDNVGTELDLKVTTNKYTLDTIVSCGFGGEVNTFKDENNIFAQMAKKLVRPSGMAMVKIMIALAMPSVAKALKFSFQDKEATLFFVNVIKSALKQRRESGTRRNDLIDLTLDALKTRGKDAASVDIDQFDRDAQVKQTSDCHIPDDELEDYMISNSLLMFIAGYETTATTVALVLWALAKYPDIQQRVYTEIQDAMNQRGASSAADLDDTTLQNPTYLDMVVHESLRASQVGNLERLCVKDYKVPGTDFVVPKGMMVAVSSACIMLDERYYQDPEGYNPENFSAEAKAARNPYAFQAFGHGPRNCIGMRFGLIQAKAALVRVLAEYKVVVSSKTPASLKENRDPMTMMPKGGVWAAFEKRSAD